MHVEYSNWLAEQKYASGTQTAQLHRVKKVEEAYGSLDKHYANGTYQEVIDSLVYSVQDERMNKPNPSKMKFEGNIKNNLQSYKDAAIRYKRFLDNTDFRAGITTTSNSVENIEIASSQDESQQKLSLERDMQAALRHDITSLGDSLKIIDDGAERSVDSGFIDITCEGDNSIVVIELKAGKADSRAIGQILGYMGDLQEEESKSIRGILVAHDFDKRAKAAARVVPTLSLKRYSIEFKFTEEQ